jgi:predicted nucleic acid-binding Zn ribbon protein
VNSIELLNVPVYVYRRRDGSTFETQQRMADDALLTCPTTGQTVERVLQRFSPRYTGTGFYSTDHRQTDGAERSRPGGGRSGEVAPAQGAAAAGSNVSEVSPR